MIRSRLHIRLIFLWLSTHMAMGVVGVVDRKPGPTPQERAKLLLANMTQAEKLSMLHGVKGSYTGNVPPVIRLGIPAITMNDGPQGFRATKHANTSTAWPSGLTIAAAWDSDAAEAWGRGQGKEFFAKGCNVMLGPGLNVHRVPVNGRNFEYLSGEDPFLGYTLVKAAISGIQAQKVVANAKHWVLNNQETNRLAVSVEVDERTKFEMYYPPFEGAIEAGVGSFMCSYNKIHGQWSCENPDTLKSDLRDRLRFGGYVMSDWGATHSTSIMSGLDMEMPGGSWMNPTLISAGVAAGNITQAAIDQTVLNILTPMFQVGVMDEPLYRWDAKNLSKNVTTRESAATARLLSSQSTVLLKNEGQVLPLAQGKKIAVIGFATDNAITHGGGSGSVSPSYLVTPLAGITAVAGVSSQIVYEDGVDLAKAEAAAAASDYAVLFVGTVSGEGDDRFSLSLDVGCPLEGQCTGNAHKQNAMIEAIARVNRNTVVVVSSPGAVLLPWSPQVPAVLMNFLPGQQVGFAIADVLFGIQNPEGKLPITIPNKENEVNYSQEQYPGVPNARKPTNVFYKEKLLVGYRYYEANKITFTTGFPFGHGLSYSTFEYNRLAISDEGANGVKVAFWIRNSGTHPGREVGQLYLSFPASEDEPPWQLKGFQKTPLLAPGATTQVILVLRPRELSVWSAADHQWTEVVGKFSIQVGSSSRDVRLHGSFTRSDHSTLYV